jgi:hypothetical protein
MEDRHREMALILKLARRFAGSLDRGNRPRVYEFSREDRALRAVDNGRTTTPFDVRSLYRRLSDPNRETWATIDIDGSLLFSTDRQRLADLFQPPGCRYRTYDREGQTVLEATFESGEVFEAWLEPGGGARPIANVRPSDAGENAGGLPTAVLGPALSTDRSRNAAKLPVRIH